MSYITLNKDNFKKEVLENDKPVLVDFWADWCGPCKMLSPIIDSLSEELEGEAKIGKVNVDDNPDLSSEYEVQGIPVVMIFKDGKLKAKIVGVKPKDIYEKALKEIE